MTFSFFMNWFGITTHLIDVSGGEIKWYMKKRYKTLQAESFTDKVYSCENTYTRFCRDRIVNNYYT